MSKADNQKPTTTFDPRQAKIARRVTLPVLKQSVGKTIYVLFTGPGIKSDMGVVKEGMEAATVARVYDLEGNKPAQIILNAVTNSTLNENYPDNGYVGKAFSISMYQVPEKRYKSVEIAEIELPEGFEMAD